MSHGIAAFGLGFEMGYHDRWVPMTTTGSSSNGEWWPGWAVGTQVKAVSHLTFEYQNG